MKYIARNYELTQAQDFNRNVQPLVNSSLVAVEKYNNGEVVGWTIEPLRKGGR